MSDLLDFMVNGFKFTPQNSFFSILTTSLLNAVIRFSVLFGVVYVPVFAFRLAAGL